VEKTNAEHQPTPAGSHVGRKTNPKIRIDPGGVVRDLAIQFQKWTSINFIDESRKKIEKEFKEFNVSATITLHNTLNSLNTLTN
ncbi:MAG TPA: hypothetical protein PLZ91_01725, partial [Bacteroidia bacterium]|nr:hypothetical protein [Bacteroidia bacterium]